MHSLKSVEGDGYTVLSACLLVSTNHGPKLVFKVIVYAIKVWKHLTLQCNLYPVVVYNIPHLLHPLRLNYDVQLTFFSQTLSSLSLAFRLQQLSSLFFFLLNCLFQPFVILDLLKLNLLQHQTLVELLLELPWLLSLFLLVLVFAMLHHNLPHLSHLVLSDHFLPNVVYLVRCH